MIIIKYDADDSNSSRNNNYDRLFFPHIFSPGRHVKAAVQAKTGASDSDPAGDGDGGAEVPRHGRCVTLLL